MIEFIQRYPFIIPFTALLLAEALKALIDLIRHRRKIRFISTGGMPSGHSALVSALVVVVAYHEGVSSTLFMVSAVLALIVMFDAAHLRQQVGLHAKILNKLDKKANLDESIGHRLFEVILGALFGAVVAAGLLSL